MVAIKCWTMESQVEKIWLDRTEFNRIPGEWQERCRPSMVQKIYERKVSVLWCIHLVLEDSGVASKQRAWTKEIKRNTLLFIYKVYWNTSWPQHFPITERDIEYGYLL